MDIAAMSIGISTAKVQQQSVIAVMRMTMDSAKAGAEKLAQLAQVSSKTMEQSVHQSLGINIDIKI